MPNDQLRMKERAAEKKFYENLYDEMETSVKVLSATGKVNLQLNVASYEALLRLVTDKLLNF